MPPKKRKKEEKKKLPLGENIKRQIKSCLQQERKNLRQYVKNRRPIQKLKSPENVLQKKMENLIIHHAGKKTKTNVALPKYPSRKIDTPK